MEVGAILYAGLISVGVAYTLQIVAQKHVDPSRAGWAVPYHRPMKGSGW